MKSLKFLGALLISGVALAQTNIGYTSDNYSGLHKVALNPANVIGSNFRAEVNLGSVSTLLDNDFYAVDLSDFGSEFNEDTGAFFPKKDNNVALQADVMLPSFMFNVNKKHSIGIITRARAVFNINEIDGELFDKFSNEFDNVNQFSVKEDSYTSTLNAWAEVGLAYGVSVLENDKFALTGGITFKYLQGLGSNYSQGKNIDLRFNKTNVSQEYYANGQLTYGASPGFSGDSGEDGFNLVSGATGFGLDLGANFIVKRNNIDDEDKSLSNYRMKGGISVTDIGTITYNDSKVTNFNFVDERVSEKDVNSVEEFEDKLKKFDPKANTGKEDIKAQLPTALHITADFNLHPKLYVNARASVSLTDRLRKNTSAIQNLYVLTPRFETKWFSFYMPLGIYQYSGFNAGAGLRFGPLHIGSSTILTNALSKNSKALNGYVGLKVPIYSRK